MAEDGLSFSFLEDALEDAQRDDLLAARARAVATPRGAQEEVRGREVLVVAVGGDRYGIDVKDLRVVVEAQTIAPVPGSPTHLLGVVTARGQSIPVLDLRLVVGTYGGGMSDLTAVVIVDVASEVFGIAVQTVQGVLMIPEHELQPAPGSVFKAVGPDALAILALDLILERVLGA